MLNFQTKNSQFWLICLEKATDYPTIYRLTHRLIDILMINESKLGYLFRNRAVLNLCDL